MASLFKSVWEYRYFILLAIAVMVFLILYVDPSVLVGEEHTYAIRDSCGVMPSGLGLQHTINNEEECDTQCFGKCLSENLDLKKSSFAFENRGACHTCSCICK